MVDDYNNDNNEENGYPADIKGLISKSKDSKQTEVRIWDMSLMFLEGRQWLGWDRNLAQYTTLKTNQGRQRVTINLLLNLYRNIAARLALAYPSVAVLPASPSADDIIKAGISENALQYYWNQSDLKQKIASGTEWMLSCGTVAFHSYYDAEKDEVNTEVVNPYDLFFESGITNPDESEWIAVRTYATLSELTKAYPDKEKELKEIELVNPEEERSSGLANKGGFAVPNRIEIMECYWRDGRHAIVAGDTYLYKSKQPLEHIPISIARYTEVPRRLWGIGLISPLIDLQWLYNKMRTQVVDNVELMTNPKWMIPKSAGINPNQITGRPGEKVYFNAAGGAPTQVAGAPIPSYVIDNISKIHAEIMDIAGIHSVSLGKRAVGVTSGKAIEALSARDVSQLQVTQASIETCFKEVATTVLQLMKLHYTKPKMIRMLDSFGTVTFKELNATNIVDTPEIFIETGSLFRDEAQDRDMKVMDLLKAQLISPQDALKELNFRTGRKAHLKEISDMAHAQDILTAMIEGNEIEIYASDNLPVFKDVFEGFMRTDDYYELDRTTQDYIRDVFLSIITAGNPDPNVYAEAQGKFKIFPRATHSDDVKDQLTPIVAASSPQAKQQTVEEQLAMEAKKAEFAMGEGKAEQTEEALKTKGNNWGGMG